MSDRTKTVNLWLVDWMCPPKAAAAGERQLFGPRGSAAACRPLVSGPVALPILWLRCCCGFMSKHRVWFGRAHS